MILRKCAFFALVVVAFASIVFGNAIKVNYSSADYNAIDNSYSIGGIKLITYLVSENGRWYPSDLFANLVDGCINYYVQPNDGATTALLYVSAVVSGTVGVSSTTTATNNISVCTSLHNSIGESNDSWNVENITVSTNGKYNYAWLYQTTFIVPTNEENNFSFGGYVSGMERPILGETHGYGKYCLVADFKMKIWLSTEPGQVSVPEPVPEPSCLSLSLAGVLALSAFFFAKKRSKS